MLVKTTISTAYASTNFHPIDFHPCASESVLREQDYFHCSWRGNFCRNILKINMLMCGMWFLAILSGKESVNRKKKGTQRAQSAPKAARHRVWEGRPAVLIVSVFSEIRFLRKANCMVVSDVWRPFVPSVPSVSRGLASTL